MANTTERNSERRQITVIYEIFPGFSDGISCVDSSPLCEFHFLKSANEEVLLFDLTTHLPSQLGKKWQWSIFQRKFDCFVEQSNPAAVVEAKGNIVRARLMPLVSVPRVSRLAVIQQSQKELERRAPTSASLEKSRLPNKGSSGSFSEHTKRGSQTSEDTQNWANLPRDSSNKVLGNLFSNMVGEKDRSDDQQVDWQAHGEAAKKMFGKGLRAMLKAGEAIASNIPVPGLQEELVGSTRVRMGKLLAEGGFSRVFIARTVDGKQTLALKQMVCHEREAMKDAMQEMELLKNLNHPNIVTLVDARVADFKNQSGTKEFMFLFPFYERGTVWDNMLAAQEKPGPWPFDELLCLKLFHGTCLGIAEMHRLGYIHRDIKPLNVLLAEDDTPILMDVGSATRSGKRINDRREALLAEEDAAAKCSAPYRPPELMQVSVGLVIDGAVDVWSLGCTLFCMAFGHSPFESPREGVMKLGIINARFYFPPGNSHKGTPFSDEFCQFISAMLKADPVARPTIQQVCTQTSLLIKQAESRT